MKTIFFISTFLLFSISFIRGQNYSYTPFVEEDTRWSYATVRQVGYLPGGAPDNKASYSTYLLKGDTTINKLIYKKFYEGCSEVYIAAIREENKKVFIVKEQEEEEQLLYDFNLQEGDWISPIYQVTKIDTIKIGETERKRFVIALGYETWIEGIGALEDFYPLQARLLGLVDQGINYQKRASELVYKTDEWYFTEDECMNSGMQLPLSSYPLKLIQREGEIELQTDAGEFESGMVFVYSIQGELLSMQPIERIRNNIIPTSGFSKGVYVIKFRGWKN